MRRFRPTDYGEIAGWYETRGRTPPGLACLPMTGFIVPGVAAGFLYATDSALGIIDCLVSNPSASVLARGRALVAISSALVAAAENMGVRALVTTTREPGVIRQAERMAFRQVGQFVTMVREVPATDRVEPATNPHPDEV